MQGLTASRPYLVRAYYDWLTDNLLTPHVVVDAFVPGTEVPQQYVKDGQIILNIASSAVGDLQITNEHVEFHARFGGVPQQVLLPMAAILAIYARENGAGTVFETEEAYELATEVELNVEAPSATEIETAPTQPVKKVSHLTLVK